MRKILLIRFSSIGDVMLTTPVIASLRSCQPEAEIHFLTKAANAPLLEHHPGITKLHLYNEDFAALRRQLAAENFDLVLDLHNSLRSRRLCMSLGVKSFAYRKGSVRTRLYARWRIGQVERIHVVERYEEVLARIGCKSVGHPLQIHLDPQTLEQAHQKVAMQFKGATPVAVNLGGKFATKKWIPEHYVELLNQLRRPVILLGGPSEKAEAAFIAERVNVPVLNAVDAAGLAESAALLATCDLVITHDSGLMHVAAALQKPIVSIWGHSVPEFGFTPWKANAMIVENKNLACRPCSKLGHDTCPKGHFKCMHDITPGQVMQAIQEISAKTTGA